MGVIVIHQTYMELTVHAISQIDTQLTITRHFCRSRFVEFFNNFFLLDFPSCSKCPNSVTCSLFRQNPAYTHIAYFALRTKLSQPFEFEGRARIERKNRGRELRVMRGRTPCKVRMLAVGW